VLATTLLSLTSIAVSLISVAITCVFAI
jgi:hypothetical protein